MDKWGDRCTLREYCPCFEAKHILRDLCLGMALYRRAFDLRVYSFDISKCREVFHSIPKGFTLFDFLAFDPKLKVGS